MTRVLPGTLDPDKVLTHYTRSVDAVLNILQHGLAWAQNGRKLMDLFPAEPIVPKILDGYELEQNGIDLIYYWKGPTQRWQQ